MADLVCPNGHVSSDPDWCDTCGAPMGAAPGGPPSAAVLSPISSPVPSPVGLAATPASGVVAPVACPHCGSMNGADNLFCESCGYDFTTGQTPEPSSPVVPAAAPDPEAVAALVAEPAAEPGGSTWIVVVEVDPAWFAVKGELSDQPCPPPSTSTVKVTQHVSLIGRTSRSRGLHPEVALDADTAVSRRHAQLVIDGAQVSIVDLSSTNGTYVLGPSEQPSDDPHPITPGVPAVLHDGDRIQLGAWTRLTVRAG